MSWSQGWRLAVGTLTVLPIRPPGYVDRVVAGRAMILAPLAVVPLAIVAAVVGRFSWYAAWPGLVSGIAVVAVLALGTRALHLDGLADTVDGLGSGRDPERALEIMRRGDVGPMGVVALLLVLGTQVLLISALAADWLGTVLLGVLIVASRGVLLVGCRVGVPAARPGGLGATVAGTVPGRVGWPIGVLLGLMVLAVAMYAGYAWWAALVGLLAAGLVAYGVVAVAVRRFGGVTGDVLGATVELGLTALLAGVLLG